MIFIADYFAIGLVIILAMFFFENITTVRVMPRSSKIFLAVLGMTAINAVTDLVAGALLRKDGVPYWLNMLVNTLYFLFNIVTTSCIAVYLFTKILEHTPAALQAQCLYGSFDRFNDLSRSDNQQSLDEPFVLL